MPDTSAASDSAESTAAEPTSIAEVIERLQKIIRQAKDQESRIGYFASLYLRVTATIRDRIGTGFFDDDERMERMDVHFANRYFRALRQFEEQSPEILDSWKLALDATSRDDLIIVSHLLAAMNPHINIDLATAAAETCPGAAIHGFRDDFNRINDVLGALVPTVISEIDDISPLIRLVMEAVEGESVAIINFSMEAARDFAWDMAVRLATMSPEEQRQLVTKKDRFVTGLGRKVLDPGFPWQGVLDLVRRVESHNVVLNIQVLDRGNPLPEEPHIEPIDGEAPNQVYYFEIAPGRWHGTFTFRLTSWRKLWTSRIGFKNKLLVSAMTLWQTILGDSKIQSEITAFPDRSEAGVAHNDFRISKGGFRLFTSQEDYILSADGSGVTVDAHVRFGPIPFLFREHDVYPATIYDGGFRALYFIKLLGGRFLGKYEVREDRDQVRSLLENDWALVEEVMTRTTLK